jgi:uncharacterized membrane protein YfcA
METIVLALVVFCASSLFSMIGLGGAIFYVPFFYWISGDFISSVTIALLLNTIPQVLQPSHTLENRWLISK